MKWKFWTRHHDHALATLIAMVMVNVGLDRLSKAQPNTVLLGLVSLACGAWMLFMSAYGRQTDEAIGELNREQDLREKLRSITQGIRQRDDRSEMPRSSDFGEPRAPSKP